MLVVSSFLFGAITAVYTPEPYIVLKVKPGPYTSNTTIGAKLGTLMVTTTGNSKIYSPAWGSIGEVSGGITLTGPMKSYPNGGFEPDATQTFYVVSVAYPTGYPGNPVIAILGENHWPINGWAQNTIQANPFRVELWLVNTNSDNPNVTVGYRPASYFELNAVYTLPSDFNPVFSFISANSSTTNVGTMMNHDGTPNSGGSYVVTNGSSGADSTPIINPGSFTDPENPGSPGITYGDPPLIVTYAVSFTKQATSFNLTDATGSKKKDVNTMRITISNGKSGTKYSQQVIFTDSSVGSNSFRLLPEQTGPTPITFDLYFDNTKVTKGTAITWNNLTNGSNNTKTIRIGGIDQTSIQTLASGTYSDTITVEIRNPN